MLVVIVAKKTSASAIAARTGGNGQHQGSRSWGAVRRLPKALVDGVELPAIEIGRDEEETNCVEHPRDQFQLVLHQQAPHERYPYNFFLAVPGYVRFEHNGGQCYYNDDHRHKHNGIPDF
jgi:hypothetical protein